MTTQHNSEHIKCFDFVVVVVKKAHLKSPKVNILQPHSEQQSVLSVKYFPLTTTCNRGSKSVATPRVWPRVRCHHEKAAGSERFEQIFYLCTCVHRIKQLLLILKAKVLNRPY